MRKNQFVLAKNNHRKRMNLDDQNDWSQQFEYIMDACMKMKETFKKNLEKLLDKIESKYLYQIH